MSNQEIAERLRFYLRNLDQILVSMGEWIHGQFITRSSSSECVGDLLRELEGLKDRVVSTILNVNISKEFVNEIRRLLENAEDTFDLLMVENWVQETRGLLKFAHILIRRRNLGLDEMIVESSKRVRKMNQVLDARLVEDITPAIAYREEDSVVKEDSVAGFEDAAKEVIKLLTGESEHLEVISIVGVLGLGKTTLAKDVFNDPKIKEQFPTRVFVHVSEEYEKKELFLDILGSFTQLTAEMKKMPQEELATNLRKQLETKKYLIVMDDVRKKEDWDQLKIAFSNKKNCSRVLITTRKACVAAHANPSTKPYYLKFLKLDESRDLLRRTVFGANNCPRELTAYELLIATKCDGIPLAIVTVANILLKDPQSNCWWDTVAKNLNDYIPSYSSKDLIIQSYKHLPYHLKLCFLYLMVLPKDFEIPVWNLVRLWIAEGFIPSEGDIELEDRAEKYLEELVGRNLVMVAERRSNGQIKTCRIYGPLRHFCKEAAKGENLLQEIENGEHHPASDEHRRLCINSNVMGYISHQPLGEHVRSFLSFAREKTTLMPKLVSVIPRAFKLMRVLEVKSLVFTRFPMDLIRLYCLKYLAISSSLKVLPSRMSDLQNMQTMIIETTSGSLEMKADIRKMRQLRHLHVNASILLASPIKAEATDASNLQTLSIISAESCRKEVLERTPKLRKLAIHGNLGKLFESNHFDSLCKLEYLENLKLLNDDDTASRLYDLPQEINFLRKLKMLTLVNTKLPWWQMSVLGKQEKLEVLKLKDNAFEGLIWQSEAGGFQHLQVLHIWRTNLVFWYASADHFPMLRCLSLRYCSRPLDLPLGLGDIPSFHTIDLHHTNQSVVSSARKIQLLKQKQGSRSDSGFTLSVYPPDQ